MLEFLFVFDLFNTMEKEEEDFFVETALNKLLRRIR